MNGDSRSVSRSFKLVVLSVSLSALSLVAAVATAQQRPDELRNEINYGAPFGVRAAGSAVASTALDEVGAELRDGRATSDKVSGNAAAHHRVPVVTDWSTKHVVFAKPRTAKDAARLEHNTRYKMQVARHNAPTFRKLADARVDSSDLLDRFRNRARDPQTHPTKADPLHRDWSMTLNGSGVNPSPTPNVGVSQFPAKFSFDITAPPDCTNDFVVYNTNTSMLVAFNNLYSGTDPVSGLPNGYCTDGDGNPLSEPTVMWAYNIASNGGTTSTSVTLSEDGSQVAVVENSSTLGSVLHIVKWHAGDGSITAPMTLPNTSHDATYEWTAWANSCGGTNPSCIWNVPFNLDLNYSSTHVGGDARRANEIRPDYKKYVPAGDTNSAPYYDYDNDLLYVGTDTANVHQFNGVFGTLGGTPAESYAPWPIYMNTTANPALTGPIEDDASGRIFVSDVYGDLLTIETNNGPTAPGACSNGLTNYPCLAASSYNSGANGLPDPPVVDSTLGTVMVFAGKDGIGGDPGQNHALAAQSLTTAPCVCGAGEATGSSFVTADFGPVNGGGVVLHAGDFDNNYYNSDTPGSGGTPTDVTGFMYVCAIDPLGATTGGNTALRQISFDSTTGLISVVSSLYIPVATDPFDQCSPVTEVYNTNTNTDLVFFSVQTHSYACAADPLTGLGGWLDSAPEGGCVMSVDITNNANLSTFFPTGFAAAYPEDGGTSGIVIDNISSDAQASSIYFTPLGDTTDPGNTCSFVGCAVKLTQVGLQ